MKIVIDIPEEMYKNIQNRDWRKDDRKWFSEEWRAIRNGTILPKGHGRLIDANNITFSQFFDAGDYAQARRAIYNAPTIIEADKGSEVDE